MSFLVSPGVEVKEIDLTNVIPAVSVSIGAYAGRFNWGPVGDVVNLSSEKDLIRNFGAPTEGEMAESFFTAASFLRYGRTLLVSRAADDTAKNASSGTTENSGLWIPNPEYFENSSEVTENFYARYPGEFGNSLKILLQTADIDNRLPIKTITVDSGNKVVLKIEDKDSILADGTEISINSIRKSGDLANALENRTFYVGDLTAGSGNEQLVTLFTDSALTKAFDASPYTDKTIDLKDDNAFIFAPVDAEVIENAIINAPKTSEWAREKGVSNDEVHIVVIDEGGDFSEAPGTILERFENVSVFKDAKKEDGSTNYYKNVINTSSQYILAYNLTNIIANADLTYKAWKTAGSVTPAADFTGGIYSESLTDGGDGGSKDAVVDALEPFNDSETLDLNLLFAENDDEDQRKIADTLIQIVENRKDAVAFVSADIEVKDQSTEDAKLDKVLGKFKDLPSTSYAVFDSGPLYVYDKYNDQYVWIPASGSIAGLCARTDETRDPWFSPAGFNRGQLLGVAKLGFNPKQNARDELYKARVNPVVSFPGQGTILFGDKTGLSRPSAFDRINVRRLFIVLEKAISTASKFSLFELNDEFTRAQFRNLVEPYLRDVRGRRGITDFLVVCDETNNTGQVIDSNRFVADIYIKPARSINFITLNFIATRTGVEFSEVVGQF
jgi:hypothetical protein